MADKPDPYAGSTLSAGATEQPKADPYDGAPLTETTTGQKVEAFSRGARGGFMETGGMVAGAVAGAGLGFAAGGPVGGAALGALGAGIGFQAGRALRGEGTVENMDPALRPYGYAGEVIGGGAPIAAAPVGIAVTGARVAQAGGFGGFINRMLEMAASSPKSFLASEAAGLASAAVAGGVTEAALPGKTLARVGAEIAGGFFNPTRLVVGTFGTALDGVKNLLGSITKSGQQGRAAEFLQNALREAGEDPARVAALLRGSGLPGIEMTSAQKSGSPALASIEAFLSKDSAKFGAERQRVGDEAMSAIKDMMVALRSTGNPEALKVAGQIRERYFRTLIAGRLQAAERDATEAAGRIATESPGARAAISSQADELLQGALRDVRAAERELWGNVNREIPTTTQNMSAAYRELRNELMPNESLNTVLEGFLRIKEREAAKGAILGADGKPIREFIIGPDPSITSSGELMRFRSESLRLMREANGAGNPGDARKFGMLAEAALDDLGTLPQVTPGLTEARTFSRELHDAFTRTFAGDATAVGRGGRDRIPPELTLKFALGGGREQGALQLRQIEEAMKFLPTRQLGGIQELDQMVDLQNRFLRVAASESVDPLTGRVSQQKLATFINKNEELLNRFPDVKRDLTQALSSATALQDVQRTLTGATKVIEQQAAFSRVANTENPADVVKAAVTGAQPVADLNRLAKLAKRGGTPAVEGLRATVWDDAIRRSTDASGNVSAERLYQNMFKPVSPNQPSLISIMHDQGIINRTEMAKAETLFKEYVKVEKALNSGTGLEKLGEVDALFDMAARMAGVHAASLIAPKGPGAIVAAGRASSFARNLFAKVPLAKMRDVLIQAASDPKFGAMLLEKPVSAKAGMRLATQIHAYMFQAGLTAIDDGEQGP